MSRPPSPRLLAARTNTRLKALRSKSKAEQGRTYFKPEERIWLYGVDASGMRAVTREVCRDVREHWSQEEAVQFCDLLMHNRYLEPKAVGIDLLTRYKDDFNPKLLTRIKSWLMEGLSENWAITDTLSARLLAPLLARFPEMIDLVKGWTDSKSLWLRRSVAVGLVPFARRGMQLEAVYSVVESLIQDREDLIQKAVGWLLREAGKKDPERLRTFLLTRGPEIPRTAIRYAIERFPLPERKTLLARTRPPK